MQRWRGFMSGEWGRVLPYPSHWLILGQSSNWDTPFLIDARRREHVSAFPTTLAPSAPFPHSNILSRAPITNFPHFPSPCLQQCVHKRKRIGGGKKCAKSNARAAKKPWNLCGTSILFVLLPQCQGYPEGLHFASQNGIIHQTR